jgi:hypothetical protein
MTDFILVTPENSILSRTHNYACEKRWYIFNTARPQKAALKAYNSIAFHNKEFRANEENFLRLDLKLDEIQICPRYEYDANVLEEFKEKMSKLEKKPRPLMIYVRNTKTNKMNGYEIETLLNVNPNSHELKNKIIFKTKSKKSILKEPLDYIQYL